MNNLNVRFCQACVLCISLLFLSIATYGQCDCDHNIPANTYEIDGADMGVKPGDIVCFQAGNFGNKHIKNMNGTADQPVILKNCGGKALFKLASSKSFGIKISNSSHFRLTGSGDPSEEYGIEVDGPNVGVTIQDLSTDFEVDHIRVKNTGYAGIFGKTDPSCNPDTWRENFTMYNVSFHDNYISNSGGEALYIGNSHYHFAVTKTCNGASTKIWEHAVVNCKVYNNLVVDSGRDGIQVGAVISGGEVYNNTVRGFGLKDPNHINGIQINPGFTGVVYNNYVENGVGWGIQCLGNGVKMFNNVVYKSAAGGLFCDDRGTTPGVSFEWYNNTIVDVSRYGLYLLSQASDNNKFYNNIIIGDGSTGFQYVSKHQNSDLSVSNNYQTQNINSLFFEDPANQNYRLTSNSTGVINKGIDLASEEVTFDYDYKARPLGNAFDIGAFEMGSSEPTANAGPDKIINLPTNTVTLNGTGSTPNTSITSYTWTKQSGGTATLQNQSTPNLTVTDLVEGVYQFQLNIVDDTGASATDVAQVTVQAPPNQSPAANAGADKIITLPTNSLTVNGSGSDPDGSITDYQWVKLSGPEVIIIGENSANLQLTELIEGTYIFQLTVTDNEGATSSDELKIVVNPSSVNQAPNVGIGPDINIVLPTNAVTINATAHDSDGSISTYLWEKKSGPEANLVNSTTADLTITDLVEGEYIIRLTVTDNLSATSYDELKLIVSQENQAPDANAGADKSITLPTNTITLNGSGSDADGSIESYLWTKVSALDANLSNINSPSLTIDNLIEGTHIFGLTVTDNIGATGYDEVRVIVNSAPVNQNPVANAGNDKSITLPTNEITIEGNGSDSDGTIESFLWIKISGPEALLTGQSTQSLTASNLLAGSYVFRLTVTDNDGAEGSDQVQLTVFPDGTNESPLVNAGGNKIISLPTNTVVLNGAASDIDGTIERYTWSKYSGPDVILTANELELTLSDLIEGVYIFQLEVEDNQGAIGNDFATVNVTSNNLPPTVEGGDNITLILPNNSVSLQGFSSDPDGTIISYTWEKISGGAAVIDGANTSILNLSDLTQGDYIFKISVTDNDGATANDLVYINVLSSDSNIPPSVETGNDITIFQPTTTVVLDANAIDSDGSIESYYWEQISGPASTLINTNTSSLTVTDMSVGINQYLVTVTDNDGATAIDIINVTVNPNTSNQPPIANAGGNKNIQLPTNNLVLTGSGVDNDGSIVTYEWTKINGPAATIENITSSEATLSNLIEGKYTFRLTITDNSGASAFDEALVTVLAESVNETPVADAGLNQTLVLPNDITNLLGIGSDNDGVITNYNWTKQSGPTNFTLTNQNSPVATVFYLVEGNYIFRLTVTDDDGANSSDDVQVIVSSTGTNISPTADGGGNQVINQPSSSLNLFGSGSDPDGSIITYIWTKISGGGVVMANYNTPVLSLSGLQAGIYQFQLRVTDNEGATNDDIVKVTVNAESVNIPPLVEAGSDKTIYLPATATSLDGNASDQDGQIIAILWEQISGSPATLGNTSENNLTIADLKEGQYLFRMSAIDNNQATAYDELTITVLPANKNRPPVANAGPDENLYLPLTSLVITGSATDPDGTIDTYQWSKIYGPSVTLSGQNQENLTIENLLEGIYVFQFKAIDNLGAEDTDEVKITVFSESVNQSPVVFAGEDSIIFLPQNSIELNGSAEDIDGTITSLNWQQISGPAANLAGADTENLVASNLTEGVYIFIFEAIDNLGISATDEVKVTVKAELPNRPPLVSAGSNQLLYIPLEQAILTGAVEDEDGTITSFSWKQITGPATSLSSTSELTISITGLEEEGSYTYRLTATDDDGTSAHDDITLFVFSQNSRNAPVAFAGNDLVIVSPNNSVEVSGEAIDSDGTIIDYLWEQINGIPVAFEYIDTLLLINNMSLGDYTFRFTVVDNDTLMGFDEVNIKVAELDNAIDPPLYFTPNGDGINDIWQINNIEAYSDCELSIYNRSGLKVFEANPYMNNWDGSYRGNQSNNGDYYYIFSCNGKNTKSGGLRIIR